MSVAETVESPGDLLARVRNLAWLDQQVFPALQWAVPGLVPEGFGLLVGPPKLGKSWLALSLGLSVALGGQALGHVACQQRPVLYLALEDGPRRLQDRARKLMVDQGLPEAFEYVTRATPGEVLPLIAGWLDQHPDGFVLLDTLGKVWPPALPGESSYQRDYRVGAHLKALTDTHPGSTLAVVHHVRKAGGEDWMDSTSGTNGLNGSADWTIALTRSRNEDAALIKVTGRDVREDEYAASIVDGVWTIEGDSLADASASAREQRTTTGLGDTSAQVVELVNASVNGVRAADVAHALGVPDATARQYLKRAEDAGRVKKSGRGLYVSVTSVTLSRSGSPGRDTRDTRDTPSGGSLTYLPGVGPTCTQCGLPIDPAAGTVHPSCEA
ncbi:MAG: AAA family ATPase [Cellulomonas sp.]|nr:AAA family ATPase [Cellulomonas sp.]